MKLYQTTIKSLLFFTKILIFCNCRPTDSNSFKGLIIEFGRKNTIQSQMLKWLLSDEVDMNFGTSKERNRWIYRINNVFFFLSTRALMSRNPYQFLTLTPMLLLLIWVFRLNYVRFRNFWRDSRSYRRFLSLTDVINLFT